VIDDRDVAAYVTAVGLQDIRYLVEDGLRRSPLGPQDDVLERIGWIAGTCEFLPSALWTDARRPIARPWLALDAERRAWLDEFVTTNSDLLPWSRPTVADLDSPPPESRGRIGAGEMAARLTSRGLTEIRRHATNPPDRTSAIREAAWRASLCAPLPFVGRHHRDARRALARTWAKADETGQEWLAATASHIDPDWPPPWGIPRVAL
jgi:hypothetical protein